MNVILNFKNGCTSLRNRYQRKTLFVVDVSVDWATGKRWKTKLVDTWKVTQIHRRYLRYIEGTSDTWKVPQIHGRYLRYMEGTSDTRKVPQIHGRYLRYMDGTSDIWKVTQIHRRYLRYMEGTSDT